uniref:NADH-ubiquinone oxidoreductase chain 2 n=1 Tax=Dineutus mellyi TaxID=357803 RepID=A0A7S8CV29_DINME|nr:NADH dehydrogenase subunit 2 [Dineutus mellyi]QPC56762.1 NADH dehydrogenase subunit 2 [Dineutus mellyi]
MLKIYKMIFFSTLFIGTMISVSSYTWLGTWMGLEINLLSFIPLMKMDNNSFSSESSMKYFLVQALASSMFLFSIILSMMTNNLINETLYINNLLMFMMNSMMMLKMGTAPFHFWFPQIIEGLNWNNSLILMTWQKIAPMMLLSYMMKSINLILIVIILSTMIGSIGGLNQTSLRKIIAYSSINHMGWMISSFLYNELMWVMYFLNYCIITIAVIIMFNNFNIYYLKQMFSSLYTNFFMKMMILFNMLSLGGLPPFLGFMPKWIIIQYLSSNYSYLLLFMILMTLITLYFYLRITYMSIVLSHNELNFNLILLNKNNFLMIFFSFISIYGLIVLSFIFNFF